MAPIRFLAAALAVTGALTVASATRAQPPLQTLGAPPTPDADALGEAMRRLAGNPRDLAALIAAGELSLKLGDVSGAAALFRRAEQVDPMNGRVKAGMARILVTQERPGEALRYFDQAVGYGLDPRSFAGDRGLAYDLIGEGERAQRDYRLALKGADTAASGDEIRRRYALSLGIAGRQLAALQQIEPLVRRNDRGAWRVRAFILAMTGDVPGATGIATSMMPPAMAQGLAPFFVRLGTLSPVDKAFAVHFGEVRPTPARLADARLVPALPVLGPDPDLRVQVAAAPPPVALARRGRGDRRRRETAPPVRLASAAPRAPVPAAVPAPGFGAPGESLTDPARRAPPPIRTAAVPRQAPPARSPVQSLQRTTLADPVPDWRHGRSVMVRPSPAAPAAQPATPKPIPAPIQVAASIPPSSAPSFGSNPGSATAPPPGTGPIVAAEPPLRVVTSPAPFAALPIGPPPPVAVAGPPAPAVVAPPPGPAAATQVAGTSSVPTPLRASEGAILARIVAGLTIPGSELGVEAPAVRPSPAPVVPVSAAREVVAQVRPPVVVLTRPAPPRSRVQAGAAATATAPAQARRGRRSAAVELADAERTARGGGAARDRSTEPTPSRSTRRSDRATAAEDISDRPATRASGRRGADRRAVVDADEDTDRKTGRSRTASARTDPRPGAKSARGGEPSRIWVQVAGGASERDLPKAWSSVQGRTPALKGRVAYSTPLRATNRVVTGPFKTNAEARAFVNQLAKQGVSAFPFTSDPGQKLTKLPPK